MSESIVGVAIYRLDRIAMHLCGKRNVTFSVYYYRRSYARVFINRIRLKTRMRL